MLDDFSLLKMSYFNLENIVDKSNSALKLIQSLLNTSINNDKICTHTGVLQGESTLSHDI